MKFRLASFSLALFVVVMAGASFTRCGSDSLGIDVDSGLTMADLTGAALNICGSEGFYCDGNVEEGPSPFAKGDANYDLQALFEMVEESILGGEGGYVNVYNTLDALDAEGLLPEEIPAEGTVLGFTGSDTVDCGDGDPEDGTLTLTTATAATVLPILEPDWEETFNQTRIVSFNNCLVEGSILNGIGASESLRLNGSLAFIEHDPADVVVTGGTETDPATYRLTGNISITERDSDTGTAGLQDFWTTPFIFNAIYTYDGDVSTENGGGCLGAGVALGIESPPDDPDTSEDDNCAEDADAGDEGFLGAGYVLD